MHIVSNCLKGGTLARFARGISVYSFMGVSFTGIAGVRLFTAKVDEFRVAVLGSNRTEILSII